MASNNVKRVAVIGAGISGVCSAAHLLKQGPEVILFERSGIAGGVWHFDERSALEPSYPNENPSLGDYKTTLPHADDTPPPESGEDLGLEIILAPPGPCYAGLMNNVSTRLMKTSLLDWPEGTEDFVSQKVLEEYVQTIADVHGVSAVARYHTRVEDVQKRGTEWVIRTTTLHKASFGSQLVQRQWIFDAIIVASGHYNMPRVPDFPGLQEWKHARPDRVWHSKGYRNPQLFKDQNILLIGAGVSSCDIAKESSAYAQHIFQSSRGGALDLPASILPNNATRVGGIKSFELDERRLDEKSSDSDPIPGKIILDDGQELTNIHSVVLCTGYIISYPFLPNLHSDTTPAHQADESVLVTADGNMVHNLYKDIFYIEDPSLIFVGVPYHISTFSFFDMQAQSVARVLGGKASLPTQQEMRDDYAQRVKRSALGRDFHSLRGSNEEQAYVADLVEWMNRDAVRLGIEDKMQGHTPEWHEAKKDMEEKLKWLRDRPPKQGISQI
ncbi:uncharacterized protein Z518_02380 [Rhinocladiella mackenziei CBS 650.93]|uniref:FAD dependent oxidoreductase domain-containing protein n=1 Tax=Rhinocladiella mackenziei CBS 650.93 TaxID=1442369 RepID=A0A0D2IWJ2_9EURO|nr:uncharacterized protein Z518_02380 [Rhinocladiella mackenziei CBS 650.93]KIX07726.1 hypothetical protein Z518_02380 [Rhinocladiella mackenziei CBS 650.93]